jgi:hypothetical protein
LSRERVVDEIGVHIADETPLREIPAWRDISDHQ